MRPFIALTLTAALAACILPPVNRDARVPLGPVAQVDVDRYAGRWFEIARFPNNFERGCAGVTAEYARREDGRLSVVNTCREPDGELRRAEGSARIVDSASNAKLKVRFGGPFEGDYWVLDRAEDYSWALVGEPSGRFLWMLARAPTIAQPLKDELTARLAARGYDVSALEWTVQP